LFSVFYACSVRHGRVAWRAGSLQHLVVCSRQLPPIGFDGGKTDLTPPNEREGEKPQITQTGIDPSLAHLPRDICCPLRPAACYPASPLFRSEREQVTAQSSRTEMVVVVPIWIWGTRPLPDAFSLLRVSSTNFFTFASLSLSEFPCQTRAISSPAKRLMLFLQPSHHQEDDRPPWGLHSATVSQALSLRCPQGGQSYQTSKQEVRLVAKACRRQLAACSAQEQGPSPHPLLTPPAVVWLSLTAGWGTALEGGISFRSPV
jgi:hypothetical protein